MNTAAIIEKWYRKIGFDPRYDRAFYDALATIQIDAGATIDTYDIEETDGKKNFLSYLYFCEALEKAYNRKGIPEAVLLDTLSDIRYWLDTWYHLKGELYLGELGWLRHHMRMQLFRLGRLQFCMAPASQLLDFAGDPILEVHVPADGPLHPDACKEAIDQARDFFSRYFPEYHYRYFTCVSWLLDPSLSRILKPDSNILRFQNMFHLAATVPSDKIFYYIFPWKTTRADLPQLTPTSPLAAKVKDLALQGHIFCNGYGYFEK